MISPNSAEIDNKREERYGKISSGNARLFSPLHEQRTKGQAALSCCEIGPFIEEGAGKIVYHDSNENHAIRTNDSYLITFYAWAGELEAPPVVPNIPD